MRYETAAMDMSFMAAAFLQYVNVLSLPFSL